MNLSNTNTVLTSTAAPTTFKSKFGYHNCDRDTYFKLKKIYSYYWVALHRYAAWQRWDNKMDQNRVIRRHIRNDKGQRIGSEIVGRMNEPTRLPVFTNIRHYRQKGDHAIIAGDIVEDFLNARIPHANASDVIPLKTSVDEINRTLATLEAAAPLKK